MESAKQKTGMMWLEREVAKDGGVETSLDQNRLAFTSVRNRKSKVDHFWLALTRGHDTFPIEIPEWITTRTPKPGKKGSVVISRACAVSASGDADCWRSCRAFFRRLAWQACSFSELPGIGRSCQFHLVSSTSLSLLSTFILSLWTFSQRLTLLYCQSCCRSFITSIQFYSVMR